MKATIDFEENLYRRLKIEAARRGRTIRELVEDGVRHVLDQPQAERPMGSSDEPGWYRSLRRYAANAEAHDLASVRSSIARGRAAQK